MKSFFNDLKIARIVHRFFSFGIILKFFNGIWETVSGLFLFFVSKEVLERFFNILATKELLENPHDFFITLSLNLLNNFSADTKFFVAVYVFGHGILNLFLAIQLYRSKIWSYVVSMILMFLFVLYQIHRIILHHSVFLMFVTICDVIFIGLTWYEYKNKKLMGYEINN
jgi:uncharacterized membrane protein